MTPLHKDDIFQRIGNIDNSFEKFAVADCMEVPINLFKLGRTCYHFTCISTDHLAVVKLSYTLLQPPKQTQALRLLVLDFFPSPYGLIRDYIKVIQMVIYYIEHVYLRPYVYSFCQIFQALHLIPALSIPEVTKPFCTVYAVLEHMF